MPGRIIRVNHDHSASPRSNRPLQFVKINLPTMIENERIAHQFHIRHLRQIIKQGIRRRRNQNLVAGIAKQTENERVSLASRSSKKNIARRDAIPPRGVIIRNCNTRDLKPASVWRIRERRRVHKRRKNRSIISKATFGRIRNGEIEQRTPRSAVPR